jgi:hypothetical protein
MSPQRLRPRKDDGSTAPKKGEDDAPGPVKTGFARLRRPSELNRTYSCPLGTSSHITATERSAAVARLGWLALWWE